MLRGAIAVLVFTVSTAGLSSAGTSRRLTRYEYNCSVRDLLGIDFRGGHEFPADNFAFGFDNNAASLSVTTPLLARYLDAAKTIAREAVELKAPPATAELERHSNPGSLRDITWQRRFFWDADYDLHIAIAGPKAPFTLYWSVDGSDPRRLDVSGDFEGRSYSNIRLHFGEGRHTIRIYTEPAGDAAQTIPYAEHLELRGPFGMVLPALPPGYNRVFTCGHSPGQHTPACLRSNLANLARRAWRRPVTPAEVDRLMALVAREQKPGETVSQALLQQEMETGIEAVLVSPSFLFRESGDLASRLSYFLWSSLPDQSLLMAAEHGELKGSVGIAREARRMLADPKSNSLAENFAAQWLEFRNLDFVHRDPKRFPRFTNALRDDMRHETEMFVESVIHEDRSVLDFVNGKYTFVNEPLAKLYGMPGVNGDAFRRVDLTGTPRAGVLTQASVLTVTSYATRTSPVLRGKWILETFLNDPPAPPPANVPALRDSASEPTLTLRQQLEQHRSNPVCAACHAKMDSLGFAMENFDAIGRWRVNDEALPIDPPGKLPDGSSFSGPIELVDILARNPETFAEGVTEKLMIFALGRGLTDSDRQTARRIAHEAAGRGYRFSDLIVGVATSEQFRSGGATHE